MTPTKRRLLTALLLTLPLHAQNAKQQTTHPEDYGSKVGDAYPADALRKAYEATADGGTVLLGDAAYLSPFFDPTSPGGCGGHTLMLNRPVRIVGTHRPTPDSATTPGKLINGSIIRGEICSTAGLKLAHLGVDEGPEVTARDFGGHAFFGIQALHTGVLGSTGGARLEDVSVLTTGLADQHSVIVEGQRDLTIDGLWIWTTGGTHGLVVKSLNSVIHNFHCSGASSDCLILKADYITDRAGDASGSVVDGVEITSLQHDGDTGGIVLDARWDSLRNLELKNVHESGTKYGISAPDSLLHTLANVLVQNWTAEHLAGPCATIDGSRDLTVDHYRCSGGRIFAEGAKRLTLRNGHEECDAGCDNAAPHTSLKARAKLTLRILYTMFTSWVSFRYVLAAVLVLLCLSFVRRRKKLESVR